MKPVYKHRTFASLIMRKQVFIFQMMAIVLALSTAVPAVAQKQPKFWKSVKHKDKKGGKAPKTYSKPKLQGKRTNPSYSKHKDQRSDTDWKKSRLEYTLMFGGSGFLGDLGGQDGIGQPFILDYEPTQTRYAISVGARYFVKEYHAIRGTLSYARIRGSDALTNYPNRKYRNITVKSPVFELAGVYEFHLIKPKFKHFAGARTTSVFTGSRLGAYSYAGLGIFAFNPRGERNGEWYSLKPLNTEGQGLPGGSDPYSRINLSFPLGFGIYYLMNRNWKWGFDVGYRWTTTDYMDDAGGFYYNNSEIEDAYGQIAAYFANPSVALDDVPNSDWYTEQQPRAGQQGNDTYLFFQVTVSKSLGPTYTNKEFKAKKRSKGRSYKSDKIKNQKRKFRMPGLNYKSKKDKKRKRGVTTF